MEKIANPIELIEQLIKELDLPVKRSLSIEDDDPQPAYLYALPFTEEAEIKSRELFFALVNKGWVGDLDRYVSVDLNDIKEYILYIR